jgi:phospholipid transport system substrate-binding protein
MDDRQQKLTRRGRAGLVLAVLVALVAPASAGTTGPGTQAVRKANDVIASLLRKHAEPGSEAEHKLAAQVTTKVRDFLDIETLGKQALVDHWAKLSKAQQTEFMSLLRELIEKKYVEGLRANLQYKVAYKDEKVDGSQRVVATEIHTTKHGRPLVIGVDYVLREDSGTWRAFDVVTDGVGLVDNYRAQFNKLIDRDGFDGLLARMRKKRDKAK